MTLTLLLNRSMYSFNCCTSNFPSLSVLLLIISLSVLLCKNYVL